MAEKEALLRDLGDVFFAIKDGANSAIPRLNAATADGDTGLYALASSLIPIVLSLNRYHTEIDLALQAIGKYPIIPPAPRQQLPEGFSMDLDPIVLDGLNAKIHKLAVIVYDLAVQIRLHVEDIAQLKNAAQSTQLAINEQFPEAILTRAPPPIE